MDLLTKSLLEDLLDTKKTVAIYGGGFKPPTKGHFTVAKKTLEDFPEIDELKIFVGSGVRDGITQDESIKIWDIYKKYLSPKVDVEASVAPVKSVLGYAKENPDTKVYWILGAREGEEGDLKDIESRTKSLSKYPNLEVKVITTSGGVSGTKTRAAIRSGNKEQFFHLTPDINDEEKEQIWNFVEPIIQENYLTSIKDKFTKFISAVKQEGKETKEAVSLLIKAAKGDIELSNEQKEQIGHQLKDVLKLIGLTAIAALPGGFVAGALIKLFKAESLITPSAFVNEVGEANLKPYKWEEIDQEGYYVYTRFVTDSETQYDVDIKTTVFFPAGQMESLPALEIEFSAKPKGAEGSSAKIVVNKGEMYKVMATIVDIIKKYIKKSKARAIIYSPSKKSSEEYFGTQRDQLYRAFISKAIPGVTFKQSGDFVTAILPSVKEASDPEAGTALPYGSGFAPVKENDFFGLNEYAKTLVKEALIETWNPKESFVSLSQYMIDNGMNIKPLPKIKVIKDDEQNASDLLGKTAYYNPAEKSITLYTMDRHPKDILRSFAHEMVHHEQNLNGKLGSINTTNTNEDGDLLEIEKEAYEKGNIMLRNWEDKIKNV
jgi:hypothetical protein